MANRYSFLAAALLVALIAPTLVYANAKERQNKQSESKDVIAKEGDWLLTKVGSKNGTSCFVNAKYIGKAAGSLLFNSEPDRISIIILQKDFSKADQLGVIEIKFDDLPPMRITEHSIAGVIVVGLKKRLADIFIQNISQAKNMDIEFSSWPEEYPASIQLPTKTFKDHWVDCIRSLGERR